MSLDCYEINFALDAVIHDGALDSVQDAGAPLCLDIYSTHNVTNRRAPILIINGAIPQVR